MMSWFTDRRRRRLLEDPWPATWTDILNNNVVACERLTEEQQQRLRDLTQVFVAEKSWEGCGGIELTDEIRITISAQACMMLLELKHNMYSDVDSILVYPSTVMLPEHRSASGLLESGVPILGQAMRGGPVILAWDNVLAGGRETSLGHNVVMHEFAHKIDMHDGPTDGTPPLEGAAALTRWARVCNSVFLALREALERGERTFLDSYAATNEAEFFAVATETYFTRNDQLSKELPRLHAVLADFYKFVPTT